MGDQDSKGVVTGRQTGRRGSAVLGASQVKQLPEAKGIVRVGTDKGWLRLRWTYQGKRYTLTLGLPDGRVNRTVVQLTGHEVETLYEFYAGNVSSSFRLPDLDVKEDKTSQSVKSES